MIKKIKVNIPDELWVNKFEKKLKQTYTYNGPETVTFIFNNDNTVIGITDVSNDLENTLRVDLSKEDISDDVIAAAIIFINDIEPIEDTFVDEVQYNGDIYKKLNNPRLKDYYYVVCINNQIKLELKIKDTTTKNDIIAAERKNYVQKYYDTFEFDSETTVLIEEYIAKLDAYIEQLQTIYPWKFIDLKVSDIPKLPITLINTFNKLPSIKDLV